MLLEGIVNNKRLHHFLIENDIVLVLKNKPIGVPDIQNIVYINRYLTKDEYQGLFLKSDIIVLAYPKEFEYRVSGVSFECVSNSKNILVLENPSLDYCRNFAAQILAHFASSTFSSAHSLGGGLSINIKKTRT